MRFIAIIIILLLIPVYGITEILFLGILEEPQIGKDIVSAKILFYKKDNTWISLASDFYSEGNVISPDIRSIKWTVAFDSKNIGQLQLEDPNPNKIFINQWLYARDKHFTVKANQKTPKLANNSKEFGGWNKVPGRRPLVLVSQPHYNDPENWKPFIPDEAFKSRLFFPLKLVMGKFNAYTCPGGPEVNELVPYKFKLEDVIIYKAYGSSIGKSIVSVGMDKKKYGCDGILPQEWADNWFLVENDNIDYLDREMTLIDAGDYDNDGSSELLFWHKGYNEDGYILIYNSFQQRSVFMWGYH